MAENTGAFGFSRDQLRDIGLGIGRGFQAYDPNNPFAGMGAALEASLASGMTREMRAEDRKQRLEDLVLAESLQLGRERRSEERALAAEERKEASDLAAAKRREEFDIASEDRAFERAKSLTSFKAEVEAKAEQAARDTYKGLDVFTLEGQVSRGSNAKLRKDFAAELPDVPRVKGLPPLDPDEINYIEQMARQGKVRGRDYSLTRDMPMGTQEVK